MVVRKNHWLEVAEVVDSLRMVPRVFLAACFAWTVYITQFLLIWYTHLDKESRGLETSGFASVVFLSVFGFLKLVYDTYSHYGRDWNGVATATTTTAVTTTVAGPPPVSVPVVQPVVPPAPSGTAP